MRYNQSTSQSGTILFLDQHKVNRQISRQILTKNGFHIVDADNRKDGIQMIDKIHPDVVVTDLFMPQLGGIDIITYMAEHHPQTPVIATCRFKEAPYLKVAKHLGAFSGLCKPFSEAELLFVIREALRTTNTTKISNGV